MCNKGIFFSIPYVPMHDIFHCAQMKNSKENEWKKKKKKQKETKCFYMIASMFSRRCESYIL